MAALNPYQVYQQNAVMMASRDELTAMLYDGVLKFLSQAKKAVQARDIQGANEALLRAQDIVNYLNSTLDPGYEISSKLAAIYNYIIRRLVEANLKKDIAIIDEVIAIVKDLCSTWRKAMTGMKRDEASEIGG